MSTSTLSTLTPASTATLASLSPADAETLLENIIEQALANAPGTVSELMLTPTVELRIERMLRGARFELNDLDAIDQLWEHRYSNAKWALRGVINAATGSGLDVMFASNFTRRKPKTGSSPEKNPELPGTGSIWRKITIELGEKTEVELAGKRTSILVSEHEDGTATASFTWQDEIYEENFESLWHAKANALKAANTVLRWWKPSETTEGKCEVREDHIIAPAPLAAQS